MNSRGIDETGGSLCGIVTFRLAKGEWLEPDRKEKGTGETDASGILSAAV